MLVRDQSAGRVHRALWFGAYRVVAFTIYWHSAAPLLIVMNHDHSRVVRAPTWLLAWAFGRLAA